MKSYAIAAALLTACLGAVIPLGSAPAARAADSADAAGRLFQRFAAARAEAGVPPVQRRAELDAVARDRATMIASLPMDRRLAVKQPIEQMLRDHGVKRFRRADVHLALVEGYDDPAGEAVARWRGRGDSWVVRPSWDALGVGTASGADGVLVLIAIALEDETAPTDLAALERDIEAAVNRVREARGLSRLASSETLRGIARSHSADMAHRGYFSHDSPEGAGPADRLILRGVDYEKVSENIFTCRGVDDPVRAAVDGWMSSPGHRKNMLDPVVVATGVGVAVNDEGALLVTQMFLLPMERPAKGQPR
jgi:uncharacterized protein YkwD